MKKTTLFVLVLAALLTYGCGHNRETRTAEASNALPVLVQTIEVRPSEWPSLYEAAGTVRARTSATLAGKVMGYVREVRVQPGDRVNAGQLLVSIDSRDLESRVLEAKAALQEAQSAVAEADNGIAAAKAQLNLAQVTFRRMEDLFKKTSISHQEFDEARARLESAEAAHRMALSKRAQLDARIAQAQQGVESATVMRSYAEIRAPFAGIVTEKQVESGQMATPGMPLLTIEQTGAYRLEAHVEESMLGRVKVGQTVSVFLEASGQTFDAKVSEIVPAVDPQSRAFLVKASLPSTRDIRSGIFGRMRIPKGSERAIVIPADAVMHRGELQSVFAVEDGLARTRLITTGTNRDGQVEVLSGLSEGERVVHPRPAALRDGAQVEVR